MWFAKLVWSSAGWIPPLLGSEIKTVIHSHKVPNSLAASGMCWFITTAAFPFGTKISFGDPVLQLVYENSRTHHGKVPLDHKEERVIEKEDKKGPEKLTKPETCFVPLYRSLGFFWFLDFDIFLRCHIPLPAPSPCQPHFFPKNVDSEQLDIRNNDSLFCFEKRIQGP